LPSNWVIPRVRKKTTDKMASSSRSGLEKIVNGILKYRQQSKNSMVRQFQQIKASPNFSPAAVFFTCIDARLQPSAFTSSDVGDMFIVRNAGNMVPHPQSLELPTTKVSTEAAALELGCVMNAVKHVVVCGHSDCKAINLLHSMRNSFDDSGCQLVQDEDPKLNQSPLRRWMREHGLKSLCRFNELEKENFKKPMEISIDGNPAHKTDAYIDKQEAFDVTDKLSQINTLVQMENVSSYPFMAQCMRDGGVKLHGFWFDIHSGEVFYFSRGSRAFQPVTEDNAVDLMKELGVVAEGEEDPESATAAAAEVLTTVEKALENASQCSKNKD